MNTTISDTFARQLREQRGALLARMRQQRGGAVGRAESAAESREQASDDWAKASEERDLLIGLEERESAELVAIDDALQRIADGSYGLCVQCGASIPTARLHAQPTAERCTACQDLQEKHAR
jgi:DnaK suppressor protein